MSWEIAGEDGAIGQFASGFGYTQFIKAVEEKKYPALAALIENGISEDVSGVVSDLSKFIDSLPGDESADTAKTMKDLMDGLDVAIITNGETDEESDDGEFMECPELANLSELISSPASRSDRLHEALDRVLDRVR